MERSEELAAKLSAIIAVAQTGIAWTQSNNHLYEQERYERILDLASEAVELLTQGALDELPPSIAAELRAGWMAQIVPGRAGYITPKISTGALCFDAEGKLLLGKRGDNGLWFIPTGWMEVGLTPAENIIKEVREETGIECRPLRIVAVRDTRLSFRNISGKTGHNPAVIHNIALTFLCETLSSEFNLHPLETSEAGFFSEDEVLNMVHPNIVPIMQHGFAAWRGDTTETYFD
jgi:8-oxo-dGTP pyrophosphatase MutT (NUDIX family)